jgi:hypothetical protein
LADRDANADARQVVLNRMQEMSDDPDVMKVITSLNIDATAAMNPAEQTPADLDSEEDKVEEMLGGDASDEFIRDISIKEPQDEMEEAVKDPRTQTEDPPGTAQPAYPDYQDDLAGILKTAGVPAQERPAPDYEDEVDEGWKGQLAGGTVGSLAGGALGSALGPIGAVVGSAAGGTAGQMIGDKLGGEDLDEGQCNMTEAGESCPVHGLKECGMYEASALQGQYGHSGRMKPVAENSTFLDRLKELSGMIRN